MGIFKSDTQTFQAYRFALQFRERVLAGTPDNPNMIEGWLRGRAGISDEDELKLVIQRTIDEVGPITVKDVVAAVDTIAEQAHMERFKRDEHGCYLEERCLKALLREAVNIQHGGERQGPTKKGAKAWFAERVFISPGHLSLGCHEPRVMDWVGHVVGRQGPQSTVARIEYVEGATLTGEIMVYHDEIRRDWWPDLWNHAEELGLGAKRSQGFGRFDLLTWEPVA